MDKIPENPEDTPQPPTLKEVRPDIYAYWTRMTTRGGPGWPDYFLLLTACNDIIKRAPKTPEQCQQVDPQLFLVSDLERLATAINRILPGGFREFASYLAADWRKSGDSLR